MNDVSKVDFNFRCRPLSNTPDGILLNYLLSFPPSKRKQLILEALRSFYLLAAYGALDNLSPEQLVDLSRSLQKNYSVSSQSKEVLNLDIRLEIDKTVWWQIEEMSDLEE